MAAAAAAAAAAAEAMAAEAKAAEAIAVDPALSFLTANVNLAEKTCLQLLL